MSTYDKSLAGKTNFLLVFNKAPTVQYFCQSASIPAISLGGIDLDTGRSTFSEVGGNLEFDDLVVEFLADENLVNYEEIYNWMMELRHPVAGNPQLHVTSSQIKSDAVITVLDNNKNPKVRFTFVDAWPNNLDGLEYNITMQADEPQIINLGLSYSYYTMENIG